MSSGNFLFIVMMLSGPLVAVSSSNWLMCWVGVELSFMGLIPLLLSENTFFSLSKESAMKYFCVQAMGSGLLMLGGIFMFILPVGEGMFLELVFLLSLVVKLGVFPMHFWVPSVMGGLSWIPMFMVLTWQKVAPFMFMANLVESYPWLGELVLVLGGLSAIVGALIGLNQTSIGPMLGASSITHSGWVAVGVVYGSLWVYFFIYCISLFFLICFLVLKDSFFSGLAVLSLSGLPPFLLFLGKWSILKSGLSLGYSFWFLVFPLLGSVLSLFFYLKFFYSFYLEEGISSKLKLSFFTCLSFVSFIGVGYISLF